MEDNQTNTAADSSPAGDQMETPGQEVDNVAELQRQRDEYYDRLLRKTAEFDNYRKRIERERQAQAESAAADVLKELLPLVDDLERALKAESAEGTDAYRRGVELILKRLEDTLLRRGVRPIEALGLTSIPTIIKPSHTSRPRGPRRDGEVIEEFGRGYMLGDRLLRPSMVKVAKGAQ